MFKWNALNHNTSVFIDHLSPCGVYRIEDHLETKVVGKKLDLPVQFWS